MCSPTGCSTNMRLCRNNIFVAGRSCCVFVERNNAGTISMKCSEIIIIVIIIITIIISVYLWMSNAATQYNSELKC